MTPDKPLYEKYDMVTASGIFFPAAPLNKKAPVQLLFNMATGSGKTLIMAGLILGLYKRGYRNFIYFVNSKNIIEKTRDNFLNSGSSKYLFSSSIQIDGEKVGVREVENFSEADNNAINRTITILKFK